jgi:hypothetical protein
MQTTLAGYQRFAELSTRGWNAATLVYCEANVSFD